MQPIDQTTAKLIAELATAGLEPIESGAHATHLRLPPGYQLQDISAAIEKTQAEPNRLRGEITLCSLESLIQAINDQATSTKGADDDAATHGYIYANPDNLTITAVFNDQRGARPGWRDHRASFRAELTPEFQQWLGRNGHTKAMTQGEFAEFIEDNIADIAGNDASLLLEVATTIQAKSDITFSSAKRLQDGQTQLGYNEVINATAGAAGALTIPKDFTLGLRIFKNGAAYAIKARLKYRLGGAAVKFWYELDRPQRAIEDAFGGYVDLVREKTTLAVLIGKP